MRTTGLIMNSQYVMVYAPICMLLNNLDRHHTRMASTTGRGAIASTEDLELQAALTA